MTAMEATSVPPPVPLPTTARTSRRGPTVETVLYLLLLVLAVASRFALLDAMAMHHDEGIHALGGWNILQGSGYVHSAVYHGPVIYHAEALGFYLFGDSDATSRVTLALCSVATVMLPALLRRYLGRWGALLASFLLLLSPSFLYFGRFGHPDAFGAFFTLLAFVCVVRYLGERRNGWLYGAVVATCLHFSSKPTAYLTTAIFLLFLGARLLWQRFGPKVFFLALGLLPAAAEDLWKLLLKKPFPLPPLHLGPLSMSPFSLLPLALAALAALGLLAWRWLEGWRKKQRSPSLDLVVVLGTMVLPLLSAIPLGLLVKLRGLPPIDYESGSVVPPYAVSLGLVAIGGTFALALLIGLLWDARRWLVAAGLFWGIFFLLHTSFFGNMTGWATGLIHALGFWVSQQGEKRIYVGPQYYTFLIPIYETVSFLFGTLGAIFFAWRGLTTFPRPRPLPSPPSPAGEGEGGRGERSGQGEGNGEWDPPASPLAAPLGPATGLLAWWAPLAYLLYSLAGEQTPWLNVHPTLPFVLLAAAWVGHIIACRREKDLPRGRQRGADLALLVGAALLLAWVGRPLLQETLRAGRLGGDMARTSLFTLLAWAISALLLLGAAYLAFRGGRPGQLAFFSLGVTAMAMAAAGANGSSFTIASLMEKARQAETNMLPADATTLSMLQYAYRNWWTLYVPLGLLLLALLVRWVLLGRTALRSTALLLFAFLCAYSLSSAWRLTYINNDTPVEMLVYVQGSSDTQWAIAKLGALSTLTTGGKDAAFLYDGEVAWPLEWYFRNYTHKIYQPVIAGPPVKDAIVAFVYNDSNHETVSKPYLEGRYVATRFYAFNWWFPFEGSYSARNVVEWLAPDTLSEILKNEPRITWRHALLSLARPSGQARMWRYFTFRDPPAPLGEREFALYVRKDLVAPLEWLEDTIPRR